MAEIAKLLLVHTQIKYLSIFSRGSRFVTQRKGSIAMNIEEYLLLFFWWETNVEHYLIEETHKEDNESQFFDRGKNIVHKI